MAFKITKAQLARRDALATELRSRARLLNIAIGEFNQKIEPLTAALAEAQTHYNEAVEDVQNLLNQITGPAEKQFDAKSERWQECEAGIRIRTWIEEWQMSIDAVDFDLPEPLEEIDPDEQADILEAGRAAPDEEEPVSE